MKKLYSTIMLLAMMVAALSLTACGGDDDEENGGDGGGGSANSTFTIIYDDGGEQVFTHDSDIAIQSLCANFGNHELINSKGSYFYMMIGTKGDFYIIFPRKKYGENLAPSYFSVGYSDFGADATDIERVSASGSGWYGEHISGSAKVTKNDGKYITINFNNYKYSVTSGININRTVYVTLKGSLAFKNSYKQ